MDDSNVLTPVTENNLRELAEQLDMSECELSELGYYDYFEELAE